MRGWQLVLAASAPYWMIGIPSGLSLDLKGVAVDGTSVRLRAIRSGPEVDDFVPERLTSLPGAPPEREVEDVLGGHSGEGERSRRERLDRFRSVTGLCNYFADVRPPVMKGGSASTTASRSSRARCALLSATASECADGVADARSRASRSERQSLSSDRVPNFERRTG